MTMSLVRRLALLEWAKRVGAWILEDDYDSEYHYAGRPLKALQGLDEDGRVIYVGTFSKTLLPNIRLGYLVVPLALRDAFMNSARALGTQAPVLEQTTLAQFIAEGHFVRHVRRMLTHYAARQAALVEAVRELLPGVLRVSPAPTGLHLVGWLPPGVDDVAASRAAAQAGVAAQPLAVPDRIPPARRTRAWLRRRSLRSDPSGGRTPGGRAPPALWQSYQSGLIERAGSGSCSHATFLCTIGALSRVLPGR
jgi:GntR family transcriptional regulator / MocR family aminotransferase